MVWSALYGIKSENSTKLPDYFVQNKSFVRICFCVIPKIISSRTVLIYTDFYISRQKRGKRKIRRTKSHKG